MSFEGYEEFLCKVGHYYQHDVYDSNKHKTCPRCNAGFVWTNIVDTTNGEHVKGDPSSFPASMIDAGVMTFAPAPNSVWRPTEYGLSIPEIWVNRKVKFTSVDGKVYFNVDDSQEFQVLAVHDTRYAPSAWLWNMDVDTPTYRSCDLRSLIDVQTGYGGPTWGSSTNSSTIAS